MKLDVILFDLDGTLCDVKHRRQYVATNPRNWDAWNAGIINDKPIPQVLKSSTHSKTVSPSSL